MAGNRLVVLMIDDEEDYSMMVKMHLEGISDFHLITSPSGKDGINVARSVKPDAILLDIMMPSMDGFEVLKKLKSDPSTIAIPVIMLTAKGDDDSKIRGAQLYDESYITKPIDAHELKSELDRVLARRGGGKK